MRSKNSSFIAGRHIVTVLRQVDNLMNVLNGIGSDTALACLDIRVSMNTVTGCSELQRPVIASVTAS